MNEEIPPDILTIFRKSGYDTKTALLGLNAESIDDLEKFICENNSILDKTSYEMQGFLKLKPGHKIFMLELPSQIRKMTEKEELHSVNNFPPTDYSSAFSHLLNMLINNAKYNSNVLAISRRMYSLFRHIYLHHVWKSLLRNAECQSANS